MKLKLFIKHKFKDALKNNISIIKARLHASKFKGEDRSVSPPSDYSVVFEDEFKGTLNMNEWVYGMPWGDFHPGSLHQYYDTDGKLAYTTDSGLVLELKKSPKTWKKSDIPEWRRSQEMPDTFTIPVGVGFVSTKKTWKYGWFESWIKLPEGQSYWPAFWLSGLATWPPEIDILEAYSHKGPKYDENVFFKLKPNRKIQPNLHYGKIEDGTKDQYGSYDVPVAECTKRFVQYVCHWERNFIKIYYDGLLIFQTTDQKILKWFNRDNAHQYLVINHGLHENYHENPSESKMIIKSVKVLQK